MGGQARSAAAQTTRTRLPSSGGDRSTDQSRPKVARALSTRFLRPPHLSAQRCIEEMNLRCAEKLPFDGIMAL